MPSHPDFAAYAADQMRNAGEIRYRKMFGEYGLYCNGKFFAVILDDQLFIKITDAALARYPHLPQVHQYGAPHHFLVEGVDDRAFLTDLVQITCDDLPAPKPGKHK